MKKELAEKESKLSVKPNEKAADDELSWLNVLSQEISENVQERINLQKAVFELEETNLRNHTELRHLDETIAKQQVNIRGCHFAISCLCLSSCALHLRLLSFDVSQPWDMAVFCC